MSTRQLSSDKGGDDWRRFGRGLTLFGGLFVALWLVLFWVERRLPLLRPGSDVIYDAKLAAVAGGGLFDRSKSVRVVVVGNSRSLSGFDPALFDAQIGAHCQSYNLGLPASNRYVEPLQTMIANGDLPTHVLVQAAWPPAPRRPTAYEWLRRDDQVMQALFPFRDLPRNLAIFLVTAQARGGLRAYYRQTGGIAAQMLEDRGYYFIEGQSFFEGNRLPDSFTLPSDTPEVVAVRAFDFAALAFQQLAAMAVEHGIRFIIIPEYHRLNAVAEAPPINLELRQAIAGIADFAVVGPDYYRYPNRFFSDHAHLNREGAAAYTGRLVELLAAELGRPPPPAAARSAAAGQRREAVQEEMD